MYENLQEQYLYLMNRLDELPGEIAECQEELGDRQFDKRQAETELAKRETEVIDARGGWAALGKNEGDRKNNLATLLDSDEVTGRWRGLHDRAIREVTRVQIDLDRLTNEFSGVRHGARLHAAWLDFLASGGQVNGTGKADNSRHTNGTATVADAEAIGL